MMVVSNTLSPSQMISRLSSYTFLGYVDLTPPNVTRGNPFDHAAREREHWLRLN